MKVFLKNLCKTHYLLFVAAMVFCFFLLAVLLQSGLRREIIFLCCGGIMLLAFVSTLYGRRLDRELQQYKRECDLHNFQQEMAGFAYAIENEKGQVLFANKIFEDKFLKDYQPEAGKPQYGHRILDILEEDYIPVQDGQELEFSDISGLSYEKKPVVFQLKNKSEQGEMDEASPAIWFQGIEAENQLWIWASYQETDILRDYRLSLQRIQIYDRLIGSSPVGIVTCDDDFMIQECNQAALKMLAGKAAAMDHSVIGHDFIQLISEKERNSLQQSLKSLSKEPDAGHVNMDFTITAWPDKIFTLRASFMPQVIETTGLYVINILDVSEQKHLEHQFVQSQKMQAVGQLAGGVAHDFNNMLTAMIGFCDLLLMRHQPGDPSFVDIMQIKQNANRAAGLVRQLLAFSRQSAQDTKPLNIVDILGEITSLLKRLIGDQIELDLRHGRDLGLVRMDVVQFEQIIINMAVNARDAMKEGGRLSIQTDRFIAKKPYVIRDETLPVGDYVAIQITDTGEGIADDYLEKIFDPFFTTKDVGEGTGLGLSMVFGAVRQANGHIFVHSGGPGKGTSFIIYLPRLSATEVDASIGHEEEILDQDVTGGGSILLVEDEDAVRLFAARALRSKGYHVTEARSGEVALDILEEDSSFDLLITDMMMPKVTGAQVIRRFREKYKDTPAICISGYTKDNMAEDVANLTNVYFLPKPFSLKTLASSVKQAIDSVETISDDVHKLPIGE